MSQIDIIQVRDNFEQLLDDFRSVLLSSLILQPHNFSQGHPLHPLHNKIKVFIVFVDLKQLDDSGVVHLFESQNLLNYSVVVLPMLVVHRFDGHVEVGIFQESPFLYYRVLIEAQNLAHPVVACDWLVRQIEVLDLLEELFGTQADVVPVKLPTGQIKPNRKHWTGLPKFNYSP